MKQVLPNHINNSPYPIPDVVHNNEARSCPAGAEVNTMTTHHCDLGSIPGVHMGAGLWLPDSGQVGFLQVLQFLSTIKPQKCHSLLQQERSLKDVRTCISIVVK